MLTDLKFSVRENIEQHSWKILYYNIIELLKNLKSHAGSHTTASGTTIDYQPFYNQKGLELVENGLTFFENLLQKLEKSYSFSLIEFIGIHAGSKYTRAQFRYVIMTYTNNLSCLHMHLAPLNGLHLVQWSVVTAQKLCLCMGDLYRYKEQFLNSRNFGKAKQYYVKAQQLLPTNGMPYNQLAIISLYTVSVLTIN